MSTRLQRNAPLRYSRTLGEAFRTPEWSNPIEGPEEGPGLLLSWGFWIGGVLSVAVWTLIWKLIAFILENMK